MKVKTLKDNVGALNTKGTVLEVDEKQAKRWFELGAVEEIKEKKQNTGKKKEAPKKEQDGEK